MSSTFDSMIRIFNDRFEPLTGDQMEKMLFAMIIDEIHSESHKMNDRLNRGTIRSRVKDLEDYLKGRMKP